jgi:peroxiredoxin|tara:strand:- start:100 stop:585 length:486 start_codon:yes stop_codon:yes gene_type:complete
MSIKVGDQIPEENLVVMTEKDGPQGFSLREYCKGKKIVLIGLPGAFTPTCHRNHLPGYLENYDALKSKGVDEIICFSTNDIFVNSAWIQSLGAAEKVIMLSDSKAEFSKALGTDYSDPFGTSIKTQRFSMYLVDSVIRELFIEQESGQALLSGALNMIDSI